MVNKSDFPRDNFDLLWMPAICAKLRAVGTRGQLTLSDFGRLLLPIPTRVGRLYPPYYYLPPPLRFLNFPPALKLTALLVTIRVVFIHKVQKAKNAIGIC